ncbi:DEAD/DEAH box helicase [Sneathiella sp.]|uniref:DEAD/DEAH box helicase n=1 Tax=Sneathiella sp. TaxID=1964365 RepID=UPI00356740CB
MTKFTDLGLNASVLRAVQEGGYEDLTPIQEQAIPLVLADKDLIGVAQTGTGKTAAFSLPLIQKLLTGEGKRNAKCTRALILAPTRELAVQIAENIQAYAKYLHLRVALVYGGASAKPQIKALAPGVDILIATPGRLLDLNNQRCIDLGKVEYLILDEADRMLDMGFIRDIQKIVAQLPKERQTLLFSATMPGTVEKLANSLLRNPQRIEVAPAATTAEKVDQHVLLVPKARKRELLAHVLKDDSLSRVLIFTRTKHGANRVARQLDQLGISSGAIHGNKSQNARQKALNAFRSGETRALVATDVAARGIDVDGVTHVINFEIPNEPESYVHRIGRTARAGAVGASLSFCDHDERGYLRDIEKIIRQQVPVLEDHPFHLEGIARAPEGSVEESGNGGGRRGASNGRNNAGGQRQGRPGGQAKSQRSGPSGNGPRRNRSSNRRQGAAA